MTNTTKRHHFDQEPEAARRHKQIYDSNNHKNIVSRLTAHVFCLYLFQVACGQRRSGAGHGRPRLAEVALLAVEIGDSYAVVPVEGSPLVVTRVAQHLAEG